jgi:hypothetical protein
MRASLLLWQRRCYNVVIQVVPVKLERSIRVILFHVTRPQSLGWSGGKHELFDSNGTLNFLARSEALPLQPSSAAVTILICPLWLGGVSSLHGPGFWAASSATPARSRDLGPLPWLPPSLALWWCPLWLGLCQATVEQFRSSSAAAAIASRAELLRLFRLQSAALLIAASTNIWEPEEVTADSPGGCRERARGGGGKGQGSASSTWHDQLAKSKPFQHKASCDLHAEKSRSGW